MSQPFGSDGASPKLWFAALTSCAPYGGVTSYARRLLPSGLNSTVPAFAAAAVMVVVVDDAPRSLTALSDELHPPTTNANATSAPPTTNPDVRRRATSAGHDRDRHDPGLHHRRFGMVEPAN